MRHVSQGLRESYEQGEEVCKEFLQCQMKQLIEVRCGRHGKLLPEVQAEFKDICRAALTFEDTYYNNKLEEFSKKTAEVPVSQGKDEDFVDVTNVKRSAINKKKLLIGKLREFIDDDCSTGQSSTGQTVTVIAELV